MATSARTPSSMARNMAAFSVYLAAILLPLSFTGGVISTPAIQQALGGSPAALSWLTNGFMLTFGSFCCQPVLLRMLLAESAFLPQAQPCFA